MKKMIIDEPGAPQSAELNKQRGAQVNREQSKAFHLT